MYRHRTAYSLGAVALFSLALLAASVRGAETRVFSRTRAVHTVGSPAEAASIWLAAKVRGRALLLFDQYPHDVAVAFRLDDAPPQSELVRWGIFNDVIRRIYLVVPDPEWEEFSRRAPMYHFLRQVPGLPGAQYLFTHSGLPMIAVRLSSLPAIRETVLVYVDDGSFDPAGVLELLARRGLRADLTVIRRRGDAP